jgi:hypothetical protein
LGLPARSDDFKHAAAVMNRAQHHPADPARSRTGAWWVADEEPEVLSADRSERPALPSWMRQSVLMLLGLAAAAFFSAVLL